MKISDLSSDQVTRLVRYVNDMLSHFEDSGITAPSGKTGQNQSSDQPGNFLRQLLPKVHQLVIF